MAQKNAIYERRVNIVSQLSSVFLFCLQVYYLLAPLSQLISLVETLNVRLYWENMQIIAIQILRIPLYIKIQYFHCMDETQTSLSEL